MSLKLLFFFLVLGLTLGQVSVAYYTDSSCSTMSSSIYYPNSCQPTTVLANTKVMCSSDGKSVVTATWGSGNSCSGSPSFTITTYAATGVCTRVSDYVYYIATCGATLPASNIVSSSKIWFASGCSTTPQSVVYTYGGCFQTSTNTWTTGSCSSSQNTLTTSVYNNNQCSGTASNTVTNTNVNQCLLSTALTQCGFVSSSVKLSISLMSIIMVLILWLQ